jgi:hypothetical protein
VRATRRCCSATSGRAAAVEALSRGDLLHLFARQIPREAAPLGVRSIAGDVSGQADLAGVSAHAFPMVASITAARFSDATEKYLSLQDRLRSAVATTAPAHDMRRRTVRPSFYDEKSPDAHPAQIEKDILRPDRGERAPFSLIAIVRGAEPTGEHAPPTSLDGARIHRTTVS